MIGSRSARAEAWAIALRTSSHSLTRELVSNQNEFEDESEMAHKKGQGSSRNGRDSNPQMLGSKLFVQVQCEPIVCVSTDVLEMNQDPDSMGGARRPRVEWM